MSPSRPSTDLLKRSLLAFAFNFALPGAGLWYLGRPAWAALNFGIVALMVLGLLALPQTTGGKFLTMQVSILLIGSGLIAQRLAISLPRPR